MSRHFLRKFLFFLLPGLATINTIQAAAQVPAPRNATWATRTELGTLENCYLVADGFYRSEQPSKSNMTAVENSGIKSLVNLRNIRKDKRKSKGTGLQLVHIPINTWRMSYDDVVLGLSAVMKADKPVLLHCIHGSDRTGVVTAAYRMTEQGWTKEAAIDEFLNGGYGYHSGWFPNILRLLESLDAEKLKADVKAKL
jgi:tyrosine-protein phosphatase SIW14